MNTIYAKLALAFMALLNVFVAYMVVSKVEGASRGGFVLTKPPIQISFRGAYTEINMRHLEKLVEEVSKVPYENYIFRENHNIRLNSIDGKSDNINVQLIENTTNVSKDEGEEDEDQ